MKKIKIYFMILFSLFITTKVNAMEALVTNVVPKIRTNYVHSHTSYREVETCGSSYSYRGYHGQRISSNRYEYRQGYIDNFSQNVFGSTGGLVGTIAGIAIGNNVGSGGLYEKSVGALIGNRIGNSIDNSNHRYRNHVYQNYNYRQQIRRDVRNECYVDRIPVTHNRPVDAVVGYWVTIQIQTRSFRVERPYAPTIGSYIYVDVVEVR